MLAIDDQIRAVNRLDGRVALVTGSSRGIGAAVAQLFAAAGARVVLHGRDEAALTGVRASIASDDVLVVRGDLTSAGEVAAMRRDIEGALGPVDVLVANAGGNPVPPMAIEDMTEDGWRTTIGTNLTATFLTVKELLPGMKARGRGAIITLSSAAARRPTAMSPVAYAAAKAGIEVFTRALALQAGPFGVRVNCIAPETILTERNAERIPAAMQEQMRAHHPIQRLGTPDDVAEAALFLASESAAWVTGVVLDVAGGSVLA